MSYRELASAVICRAMRDGDADFFETDWGAALITWSTAPVALLQEGARALKESAEIEGAPPPPIPETCRKATKKATLQAIGRLPHLYTSDAIAEFMGTTRKVVSTMAPHWGVKVRRLTTEERSRRARNQWSDKAAAAAEKL